MANNYNFLDAYGSVKTAATVEVSSAHQPIVQINSALGAIPVTPSPASVSGVGLFNVNHTGNGSIITVGSPASVSGVGTFNVNHIGNGSIFTVPNPGSVSGVGIFNINHTGNGSILTLSQGSIITINQATSIAGTYTEDSAHATNDRGIFTLRLRNDNMSSVTSADGDYSPDTVGPIGETITANAPITKWWQAQTSVMYGTSVQALAPQGASVFTYVTGIQVANDSATFSRVKFTGGLGSVLAWTVAPANGGSNITFVNPIKTGENSGFSVSINGVSSVYISAQGFISKT